jgi:beta-lactamase regulating signal transducer with metallopeptidase domain
MTSFFSVNAAAIVTHLVVSSIVLLLALVAARAIPLTARTRHALLFGGLLKFALPSSLIVVPLRWMGVDLQGEQIAAATFKVLGADGPPAREVVATVSRSWPEVMGVIWLGTAVLLLVIGWLTHARAVAGALRGATPPSPRETSSLVAARERLGLQASIELIRSAIFEAPAVLRIVRPVIVLPPHGCDGLDEAELVSLLTHECAHVARRDNLLGRIEHTLIAALWFHPLAWIAQREIATAREEACDEIVADADSESDTYLAALTKICRAALAPRIASISCMANAKLKERLEHLMNYETLRTSALSHRSVVGAIALFILATTAVSGVLSASPKNTDEGPYSVQVEARKAEGDQISVHITVRSKATGEVVFDPSVTVSTGRPGAVTRELGDEELQATVFASAPDKVRVEFSVSKQGQTIEKLTLTPVVHDRNADDRTAAPQLYTGEPISLKLKHAQLSDVMRVFGQLTGNTIVVDPSLADRFVDVDAAGMPWDQALDLVGKQVGARIRVDGKIIYVEPAK